MNNEDGFYFIIMAAGMLCSFILGVFVGEF